MGEEDVTTNEQLVKKATIAVADLAAGGALNPEQAARFIRTLRISPTLLNQVRTVEMSAPQRYINKIQFADPILKPGVSNTALLEADRSKPTTDRVTLDTEEVIAEVRLPYDVIEDVIEGGNIGMHREGGAPGAGGGFIDTVLTLMAERAAEDLENLAINGDTAGGGLLGVLDGYLKLLTTAGTNVVDNGGAQVDKDMFKNGVKTLPDQYLRNRSRLRHFISQDQETEYRDTVADRATAAGDSALGGLPAIFVFGVPVEAVSLMPEDQGIFTDPLNLIWGIQRDIHLEWDKEITARVIVMVLSARIALQIEETNAAVLYTNIGS